MVEQQTNNEGNDENSKNKKAEIERKFSISADLESEFRIRFYVLME